MALEHSHDLTDLLDLPLDARSRLRRSVDDDPLVREARLYSEAAAGVLAALRPLLEECSDLRALEAISCIAGARELVERSVWRALIDRRVAAEAAGFTLASTAERDALASASVALFVIDESRRAWQILASPGRGVANGVPVRLAAVLTELEVGLGRHFPDARALRRSSQGGGAELP